MQKNRKTFKSVGNLNQTESDLTDKLNYYDVANVFSNQKAQRYIIFYVINIHSIIVIDAIAWFFKYTISSCPGWARALGSLT